MKSIFTEIDDKVANIVSDFFGGNEEKIDQWFRLPNPGLGNLSPYDMIRLGRYEKLKEFVLNSLDERKG